MNSTAAIRPGWTIARSMWLARRPDFLVLGSAPFVCGWLFHLAPTSFTADGAASTVGFLLMGLSLFLTFVFCNFTEQDRRGRLDGFPSRLFTLPVATRTLVAAPLLFSVLAIGAIYAAWAKLALPAAGRNPPLAWPILYLTTGIICYQSTVWTLAGLRAMRMIVLGVGGTVLAVGWLFLLPEAERDFLPGAVGAGWPVHTLICAALVLMSLAAWGTAHLAVERQRRGEGRDWKEIVRAVLRRDRPGAHPDADPSLLERLLDALPQRRAPLRSPAQAQLWFEWRRHGSLLPLTTGAVLLLIMAPAPFCSPIGAELTGITLGWILALPLFLAFVLGKGFGKADLWSKEPGLPLFHATRPLSHSDWIGAKIKAATLATASSWSVVLLLTPLWLWLWCDSASLLQQWRTAASEDPNGFSTGSGVILLLILILCTWRFLVGSLYLGLSGKPWMLHLAACGVFLSLFTPLLEVTPLFRGNAERFLFPPPWFRWLLLGCFAAKVATAAGLTGYARRQGFVTNRAIVSYLMIWLGVTALMIILVRQLVPLELIAVGWNKRLFTVLTLFFVPLLRVSYAPIALARSRRG